MYRKTEVSLFLHASMYQGRFNSGQEFLYFLLLSIMFALS